MYRQIWIAEEDRVYQAILWRESCMQAIKTYLLKTVTYGTSSAPFQATRCLKYLADVNADRYPRGAKVINSEFYVDDLISGANSKEELVIIKSQVEAILKQGKFKLTKWFSNEPEFCSKIDEKDREKLLRINDADIIKALGIIWDPIEDQLCFRWVLSEASATITKRNVLADLASLYDPLGLLNPIIVKAKVFMQELWAMKLSWDEPLEEKLAHLWRQFRIQLSNVKNLRVPRYINAASVLLLRELHGFADASNRAYGCCLYVRSQDSSGKIAIHLIAAKSRVAPLKTLSMPRLELCAVLLLVKLFESVRSSVGSFARVYFWSDSEIVLHWIHGHPSRWSTYVSHRVAEIQEITANNIVWRYVNSQLNPADIISKGAIIDELLTSRWFIGPSFLQQSEEFWPQMKRIHSCKSNIPEERKVKTVLITSEKKGDIISEHKFVNNFLKIRRVFAYVMRFYKNVSRKLKNTKEDHHHHDGLSPTELDEAFRRMIYVVQQHWFQDEILSLLKEGKISPQSPIKGLIPFLDSGSPKLLRVGGRLQNANIPFDSKHPILLPKNHPLVLSYVTDLHKRYLHAGSQALVSFLRQRFWVVNAKSLANWVVRKCIHCFHYRPKLLQQVMGQLPALRLEAVRAFLHCGVDFCGPFVTTERRRGRPFTKSYVAVFICFASKAVHLEVVSNLSSDAFIAALTRFVGRRGICATLSCDNATNFVGARNKLEEFRRKFHEEQNRKKISDSCAEIGIEFRFIPPRAPHFGGLWEAAVKSAKYHLLRTINELPLTFEELGTIIVQVESILNSRPISAMSSDPNDEGALTPGHFLVNGPLNAIPQPDITYERLSSLDRWRALNVIQQRFWQKWSREYVPQLQQRYKWSNSSPDVRKDTLVLIADDQHPPQHWLLGRIEKAIQGPDGKVRVLDIRTKGGIIRRSVHKVAPLPLNYVEETSRWPAC